MGRGEVWVGNAAEMGSGCWLRNGTWWSNGILGHVGYHRIIYYTCLPIILFGGWGFFNRRFMHNFKSILAVLNTKFSPKETLTFCFISIDTSELMSSRGWQILIFPQTLL